MGLNTIGLRTIGTRKPKAGSVFSWNRYWTKQFDKTKSQSVLIQGDSTGDGTTEWVYLMAQYWASICLDHSVRYKLWSDANQSYGDSVNISTGRNGDGYIQIVNDTGSITTPHKDEFSITGDIEVIAKINCADYTSGADQVIISKFGGAGYRSWALVIGATGRLYFWWGTDGTANLTIPSTAGLESVVADGADIWVKATLDVDNDASGRTAKYYTSTDGKTWTQLGNTVTQANATSIFAGTYDVKIGMYAGGSGKLIGKVYRVIVKNGINGKAVLSPDFGQAFPSSVTTFKDAEGNVWTKTGAFTFGNGSPELLILNASTSGKKISYSADVTRFGLQTPIESKFAYINYSHNEGSNADYTTEYQNFCNQILAKYANAKIVCIVQNPQQQTEIYPEEHATRVAQIKALAIANSYGYADIYKAFIDYGDFSQIMMDGCHPNAAGSIIWRDKVIRYSNKY